jgi:hypothetical protein
MKKSFSMAAAMMAAAVLSVSSFVSCDDDDEKFESIAGIFEERLSEYYEISEVDAPADGPVS